MKWFLSLFSDSLGELKKLSTLTTTGILTALGIALEYLVVNVSDTLQIKFSFLAVALIAMLYGPVVSMMSATILDIVSGLLHGEVWPELVLVKILAGLIFGILLYKAKTPYTSSRNLGESFGAFFKSKYGYLFMLRAFISKLLVNVVCNIFLTTLIMRNRLGGASYIARLTTAIPKNLILLPIEVLLMLVILVPVYNVYNTYFRKTAHKAVR